jgi:hypothetical protein
MAPQKTDTELPQNCPCLSLLHDDSVRLFDVRRMVFGGLITGCLFMAAHFWL